MKTYENKEKTKRMWYDRKLRLWTLQDIDEEKNQINSVNYMAIKFNAFKWFNQN